MFWNDPPTPINPQDKVPEDLRQAGGTFELPEPAADLLPPPEEDNPHRLRDYFDPERWDEEVVQVRGPGKGDPVQHERGKLIGQGSAVLVVSDFHLADGTAGGDDFLESHLHLDEDLGVYTG